MRGEGEQKGETLHESQRAPQIPAEALGQARGQAGSALRAWR